LIKKDGTPTFQVHPFSNFCGFKYSNAKGWKENNVINIQKLSVHAMITYNCKLKYVAIQPFMRIWHHHIHQHTTCDLLDATQEALKTNS
jgi:hypothetical protein